MKELCTLRLFVSKEEERYSYCIYIPPFTGGGGFLSENLNEEYTNLNFDLKELSKGTKIKILSDIDPPLAYQRRARREENEIFQATLSKRFPDLTFILKEN